jgi:hypothetical protein
MGVRPRKRLHRQHVAVLCGFMQPELSLLIVLRYTFSVGVHESQVVLRLRVSLFGRPLLPTSGSLKIFRHVLSGRQF